MFFFYNADMFYDYYKTSFSFIRVIKIIIYSLRLIKIVKIIM